MKLSDEEMLSLIKQVTPADFAHFKNCKIDNFHETIHEDFSRLFPHTLSWLNQYGLLTKKHIIALFKRWNDFFSNRFFQIKAIDAAYTELVLAKNHIPSTQLDLDQDKLFYFLVALPQPELTVRFLLQMEEAKLLDHEFFHAFTGYFTPLTPEKIQTLNHNQTGILEKTDPPIKAAGMTQFRKEIIFAYRCEQLHEVKKNARLLHALKHRYPSGFFQYIPTEILVKIAAKTSDLDPVEANIIAINEFKPFEL